MKRHGDLWDKIVSKDNIYNAYRIARKKKSKQRNVKSFEKDLDKNIFKIQKLLINKSYEVSPYREKIIYEPKQRTIYMLPFSPDRIIQHALMNVLEPIWNNLFTFHSYACRKMKGIHAASRVTMNFVRRNKYCLKLDISKFYPSINHEVLYNIVLRKIKDKNALWLIRKIIDSFHAPTNVPIGNYTSQWFGNLYLNELDMLLKHKYKVKNYIRYCDDSCLFSNSKEKLNILIQKITHFLQERLQLRLSKCDLFPVIRGVDFLGYRHFPNYILLRKSTAKRIKKKIAQLPILLDKGIITPEYYRSYLASIKGWLKWGNTYNLKKAISIEEL